MAKILHTSDWHVGKAIRGNSRAAEHRAVLAEITSIAAKESVDLVVVAGDLFETSAPSPESEQIVYRALLDLADTGATVAVISGNHDNAHRLRAVSPLLERGQVHLLTEPTRPDTGGVRRLTLRSGEPVAVAMLPFVSQRGIVRAEQLMHDAAYEHAQLYAERLQTLIELLCHGLDSAVPSLMLAHAFVDGGRTGGGERHAHLVEEYAVVAQAFPANLGYVALGHLHRAQKLPGATAIHYCGSPIQLDFGETNDTKQINLVDLQPGKPAKVTAVELSSGYLLFTLGGSVAQIAEAAGGLPEACWIRARVDEPRRAGLAEEIREALGDRGDRLVDVIVTASSEARGAAHSDRQGHTPRQLFDAFLVDREIADLRLGPAFDELHDTALDGADR
jgi:exonuclease SbcD